MSGTHWGNVFASVGGISAGIGLGFNAVAYVGSNRIRRGELAREFSRRWDEAELADARRASAAFGSAEQLADALQQAFDSNAEEWYILIRVPNFFEDVGLNVKKRLADVDLTAQSLGQAIVSWWEVWLPAIRRMQETDASVYKNFEDLATRMKKKLRI